MFHTIAPLEAVFANRDAIAPMREYTINGVKTLVRFSGGTACVERIISSDPNDFLAPRFPPGTNMGRIAEGCE